MVRTAGIDYSLSCPSITLFAGDSFNFEGSITHFLTNHGKFASTYGNIIGSMQTPYASEEERYDNISDFFINIIKEFNCDFVAVEGYSMGSRGRVFNIAENCGLLKYKLYKNNIKCISVAPTTVKKYATGKGKSKKEIMYEAFLKETSVDLREKLSYNKPTVESPLSDIVDSYFICKYIFNNF